MKGSAASMMVCTAAGEGGGGGRQSQQGGEGGRGAAAADHLLSPRASCRFISYRNHGLGNLIVAVCAHGALQGDPADGGGDHSLRQRE